MAVFRYEGLTANVDERREHTRQLGLDRDRTKHLITEARLGRKAVKTQIWEPNQASEKVERQVVALEGRAERLRTGEEVIM